MKKKFPLKYESSCETAATGGKKSFFLWNSIEGMHRNDQKQYEFQKKLHYMPNLR